MPGARCARSRAWCVVNTRVSHHGHTGNTRHSPRNGFNGRAECFNPIAVVMRAEALSRKEGHVGAVAFSRTGDPATGDFSDAKVIRKFGNVPDDLSVS